MKMTTTTPTMMNILGLSPVVLGGVGVEGDVVVRPGGRAVVVVETTAIPGGEEGGDDESSGAGVDDTIVAIIVCVHV